MDEPDDTSQMTLRSQGGAMSDSEHRAFATDQDSGDALILRHADEAGKVSGAETPRL